MISLCSALRDYYLSRRGTHIAVQRAKKILRTQKKAFQLGSEFYHVFRAVHEMLSVADTYNLAYVSKLVQYIDQWDCFALSDILGQYVDTARFFTAINVHILYKVKPAIKKAFIRGYICAGRSYSIKIDRSGMAGCSWFALYDYHPVYLLNLYAMLCRMVRLNAASAILWNSPSDKHSFNQETDKMPYKMVVCKMPEEVLDPVYTLLHWLYYDKDLSLRGGLAKKDMLFSPTDAELYSLYATVCAAHDTMRY